MAILMQEDTVRTWLTQLYEAGWAMMSEEWSGALWHLSTTSLLIVYVDDFKLLARVELHAELWAAITSVIDNGEGTTDVRFLGCVFM